MHVVVGADLEPGDAVGLLVARGQHHDRNRRAGADPAADVEAVLPRQADVEDDEPRPDPVEVEQRVLARAGPRDPVAALLQIGADERADRLLVLDEQELRPRRRGTHLPTARTSPAGESPSRMTVATIPRRSAENDVERPLSEIEAFGATAIVTTVASRSRRVSEPGLLSRITPRSIR